ncbi:uncharacterized protein LOC129585637 [Paramacrobiotus metropolitanus]|uniref:uncharacterized protein LOC129585637 n=1 Tax=Paramacrobiotus metropolitanus TaxID=2943436 RepID=UPI0024457AA9|nr:uncharacterized protein LOC129585637 [Paramacrobiotus metropolitanus]XP_055334364.1 uncharacterized protein LOC129585637 [Paramacrobiotus metropolitanus]
MLPERGTGSLRMPVALNFLDLAEPRLADNLKQNGETLVKFIGVLGEYLQKSAALYEQHGEELKSLATQGRQQLQKLANDGDYLIPSLLKTWDQMLNYTAISGEECVDLSNKISSDIVIRLFNSTSHRKVQTQKLFEERSTLESVINQAEEQFYQAQKNYVEAYSNFLLSNGDRAADSQTKSRYLNAHNAYVLQLHRYNSLMEDFQNNILPQWFQEVENMYTDVYSVLCTSLIDLNQRQGIKTVNESKRCEEIIQMAKQVDSKTDLIMFARGLDTVGSPVGRGKRFEFQPPAHSAQDGPKDEIVMDNFTTKNVRSLLETLADEEGALEGQLKKQYQILNDLLSAQQKHMEMHLYSKVSAVQEEISETRKIIRTLKIKISAVHGQLCILDGRYASRRSSVGYINPADLPEPVMSNAGMKTKWKRAFFNLKRNGTLKHKESLERIPQEYVGSISDSKLRPGGQKSPRLRRNLFNRSDPLGNDLIGSSKTSLVQDASYKAAIGNGDDRDMDPVYLLLKKGANLNSKPRPDGSDSGFSSEYRRSTPRSSNDTLPSTSGAGNTTSSRRLIDRRNSSMSEPESTTAQVRAPMLNARMKSISLDNEPPQELIQGRKGKPALERGNSTVAAVMQGAQSPGAKQRLLQSMKMLRHKSLDYGESSEKDSDIALLAPTVLPKPVERSLPLNVFVALQSYRPKGPDELELRPGDRIVVTDTSQPDWWKGKGFGTSAGYFPRECVARVNPNEKVCVVTHALQLNENGTVLRLSKDDIVMTTGPDEAGMVPIRCGGKRACCPLKYLQMLGYFDNNLPKTYD